MNNKPRNEQRKTFFPKGYFPLTLYVAKNDFKRLKNYFDIVADHLKSEDINFSNKIDVFIKSNNLTGEEADFYYDKYSEEVDTRHSFFPNILRSTILVSSCSLLEASLLEICNDIESEIKPIKCKWDNIEKKYTGIRRAGIFLEENISIAINLHPKWQKILDYYEIRNAMVHADGNLYNIKKNKLEKVKQALNRLGKMNFQLEYEQIRILDSLLKMVIEDIIIFWNDLEKAFIDNAIVGPKYWP